MAEKFNAFRNFVGKLGPHKKKILSVAGLFIALIGLGTGVYLVGQRHLFTPFADVAPITFKDPGGNPLPQESGTPITETLNVKIELNAP